MGMDLYLYEIVSKSNDTIFIASSEIPTSLLVDKPDVRLIKDLKDSFVNPLDGFEVLWIENDTKHVMPTHFKLFGKHPDYRQFVEITLPIKPVKNHLIFTEQYKILPVKEKFYVRIAYSGKYFVDGDLHPLSDFTMKNPIKVYMFKPDDLDDIVRRLRSHCKKQEVRKLKEEFECRLALGEKVFVYNSY